MVNSSKFIMYKTVRFFWNSLYSALHTLQWVL